MGAFGEPLGAHGGEGLVCGAQLLAGVDTSPLATEPLTVDQLCPRKVRLHARAVQSFDCFDVKLFCTWPVSEQCPRTGGSAQCPVCATDPCALSQYFERLQAGFPLTTAAGGFDQFDQAPAEKAKFIKLSCVARGL